MQSEGKWQHIVIRLKRALSLLGRLSPAPWLIRVGFQLVPRVYQLRDWFDVNAWCQDQTKNRLQVPSRHQEPDTTHYMIMEDMGSDKVMEEALLWVSGDSLQVIAAGR
ncbi:hypothetical protein HIM_08487 [Hirsutella minnesotensis 3608]|uniref:Uncharacterized protein n=1 Tax=Hirsutella minnesotensis 3608 TaxID=1043627 RepID=A0A0F8A3N0_9HYPO|nr:hypothetical protein HIM_08487 [Hirsutella minnesotensis 3608]